MTNDIDRQHLLQLFNNECISQVIVDKKKPTMAILMEDFSST